MSTRRSGWSWRIWRWPVVIALLTAVGLVAGLFSDGGVGDAVAAVCLAVPTLAALWYGCLKR